MEKTKKYTWRTRKDLRFSFLNAFRGIAHIVNHHYNARLIFLFAILAVILGFFLKVTNVEMFVLGVTIMLVFITEVINTLIEDTIDLFSEEFHPKIKIIKDVAAGVVLAAVGFSLVVGYFIFGTRICRLLNN